MGKSNGICKICNVFEETTCHLLYECQNVYKLWSNIAKDITKTCKSKCSITKENVLFGMDVTNNHNIFIDFVILETKWQIWKNRNNVKYGNKQPESHNNIFKNVRKQCDLHLYTILKNAKLKKLMKSLSNY